MPKIVSKNSFVLFFILIIALIVRFSNFPNNIYFGYDQAKHAYDSTKVIQTHDIILSGPSTDITGVYHGPLYYYIIGLVYFFGNGSPLAASAFLLIANAFGVFLIYLLGKNLYNSSVGLLSAFVFAISFEQYQYSYYLSNPSLAILSVILFYLGVAKFVFKSKPSGLFFCALGLATGIHFEFLLVYLAIPGAIWIGHKIITSDKTFKKLVLKPAIISLISFTVLLLNFIVAEFKYNFRMLHSLLGFGSHGYENLPQISQLFELIVQKYTLLVHLNIFGLNFYYSGFIFLLVSIYFIKAKKTSVEWFILSFLVAPIMLYLKETPSIQYFTMHLGTGVLLISFISSLIIKSKKFIAIILISLIILGNISLLQKQGDKSLVWGLLIVQNGMVWKDLQAVVDYTYQEANYQPFEIKVLSMPLKIQTTWSYLYEQIGKKKYGYMPYSFYDDVLGFPGTFPHLKNGINVCTRFLISEPMSAIAPWYEDEFWTEGNVKIVSSKNFGLLRVQKRIKTDCNQ